MRRENTLAGFVWKQAAGKERSILVKLSEAFTGTFDAGKYASTIKTVDAVKNKNALTIKGNGNANLLKAGSGKSKLYGYAGKDTLLGGAASDLLDGGAGNDSFIVADIVERMAQYGAVIAEAAGKGTFLANRVRDCRLSYGTLS